MSSQSSVHAAPWQFDWKRPIWQRIKEDTASVAVDTKKKPSSSSSDTITTPVAHVAAAVQSAEIGVADDIDDGDNDDISWMLTVTLSSSSSGSSSITSKQSKKRDKVLIADVITLELVRQTTSNETPECKCLQKKTLRWPTTLDETNTNGGSSSDDSDDDGEEEEEDRLDVHRAKGSTSEWITCFPRASSSKSTTSKGGEDKELPPCFLDIRKNPLLSLFVRRRPMKKKARKRKQKRKIHKGLISAALVRLPPGDFTSQDANDFLNLLSMVHQQHQQPDTSGSSEYPIHDDPTKAPSDLVLACLTSDNMVHFYSVWTLLANEQDDATEASKMKKNAYEDGMASMVFGSSLLSTLQDTVLPLSQPDHSVRLSVPFLETQQQRQSRSHNNDDNVKEPPPSSEQTSSATAKAHQQPPKVGVVRFLEASAWDPTIDAATLPFQTKHNITTHCVAALEYLCIAGRGEQRWNYHNSSSDYKTTAASTQDTKNGGFVTFISLRTFSEKQTLFLPFVPDQISPFLWGPMSFLLVVGQGNAAAIRMDAASSVTSIPKGESPVQDHQKDQDSLREGNLSRAPRNPQAKKTLVPIQRFQILPICLSYANDDGKAHPDRILLLTGSETSTSPPGITILSKDTSSSGWIRVTQRSLCAIDVASSEHAGNDYDNLFAPYHPSRTASDGKHAIITTIHEPGKVAQVNAPSPLAAAAVSFMNNLACHLGQGWCVVRSGSEISFVCLEGGNSERGAYVSRLVDDVDDKRLTAAKFTNDCIIMSSVLAVNPFSRHLSETMTNDDIDLPFSDDERARNESVRLQGGSEELDDIVVEAMESISSLSYRDAAAIPSPRSFRAHHSRYTNREKSQRLLRHCSSWTKLENGGEGQPRFASQTLALSVRLKSRPSDRYILSLRKASVESGVATPFQKVLAWLSDRKDYFTAASLALDLLRDDESLRHLWRAFDKIDDENECSKLERLLDGITPIRSHKGKDKENEALHSKTTTQLADMTVGLLTKGGYAMSTTLEQFLGRNIEYDPSRACLMLVATVASALSDDDDLVASVMGKDYRKNEEHENNIMWPVRCLLTVGATRDHLRTALLLLNTTIPDELRRRQRGSVASTSVPSMQMCKSLVTLIVGTSQDATEILLDFVDEKTRFRFWQSLEHETRLELSLVSVNEKSPMLRDAEVRSWAIAELQKCIEFEDSASSAIFLPTPWLKTLVTACLRNSGCCVDILSAPMSEEEKNDPVDNDEDGLKQHAAEVSETRRAITPAHGSGGIDFDLLIPALLVLVHRDVSWHDNAKTSTRALLNAICYSAGRPSTEEPAFVMNSASLMQQCTLAGDVEAGANLIGGVNGLTLECCHILIEEVGMDMEEAETFLLSVPGEVAIIEGKRSDSKSFEIRSCHRRILWLLEEHVLRIRTYGEFETTHSRGRIDPVFAATLCLRTWWTITRPHLEDATKWLQQWLRRQLSIMEKTDCSQQRLACAALVRALVWPVDKEDDQSTLLATKLRMDGLFLVQLTQSCCGLVEALPNFLIEGNWKMSNNNKGSSTVAWQPVTTREGSVDQNATGGEDSFVSAAASLRDLDTSWMSL